MRFVLGYLLVFLVILGISSLGVKSVPMGFQGSLDFNERLYGEFSVKQVIYPTSGNLSDIALTIRNPVNANDKDLLVKLVDSNDQVVREKVINGRNIPDGDYLKVNFSPVVDSAGKSYFLALSSPKSEEAKALQVYLSGKSDPSFGDIYVKDEKKPGHIAAVLFYSSENKLNLIGEMINSLIQRLGSDLGFTILYLVICLGSVFLYFYVGKKKN